MDLKIKPVTPENYADIQSLHTAPGQENFIETTSECLFEAKECSAFQPVGIYDNDTLIGFAMYGLFHEKGMDERVWLDRFLIDARYQGRHYGETALLLLIDQLVKKYQCNTIYLSLYEDNKVALSLYQKHGFHFNNELDIHGEKVMVKTIS